jgi:hypothetical protein
VLALFALKQYFQLVLHHSPNQFLQFCRLLNAASIAD